MLRVREGTVSLIKQWKWELKDENNSKTFLHHTWKRTFFRLYWRYFSGFMQVFRCRCVCQSYVGLKYIQHFECADICPVHKEYAKKHNRKQAGSTGKTGDLCLGEETV